MSMFGTGLNGFRWKEGEAEAIRRQYQREKSAQSHGSTTAGVEFDTKLRLVYADERDSVQIYAEDERAAVELVGYPGGARVVGRYVLVDAERDPLDSIPSLVVTLDIDRYAPSPASIRADEHGVLALAEVDGEPVHVWAPRQ